MTDDYYDEENQDERELDEVIFARLRVIAAEYAALTGQGSISAKEEMKGKINSCTSKRASE